MTIKKYISHYTKPEDTIIIWQHRKIIICIQSCYIWYHKTLKNLNVSSDILKHKIKIKNVCREETSAHGALYNIYL